jgi:hypothetical protein
LEGRHAELVVLFAFVIVVEDIVGFLDLLEFLRGIRGFIQVGVIHLRQFAIGAFDFVFRRGFADAENLIIVAFFSAIS